MNCPRCGSVLVKRSGKYGPFIGCSSYPECKYTQNINKQSKEGIIVSKEEHPKIQDNLDIVDIRPFYAKSLQDNLDVSFFQSLAIPFNFLNTYFNHEMIKQLNYYSKFRIDYTNSRVGVDETEEVIYGLALKILIRGRLTYNSLYLEKSLREYFKVDKINVTDYEAVNQYLNYQDVVFASDSFREDKFVREILPKVFESYSFSHCITQVKLESLIKKIDNYDQGQRVDFLVGSLNKFVVVEIDGDSHLNHQQKDQLRDQLNQEAGLSTIRITNDEIERGAGSNINKLIEIFKDDYQTKKTSFNNNEKYLIALKITHQFQVAVLKALEKGLLRLNGLIYVDLKSDAFSKEDLMNIFTYANLDVTELINHFFKLYNINKKYDCQITSDLLNATLAISFGNNVNFGNKVIINDISTHTNILPTFFGDSQIQPSKITEDIIRCFLRYLFRFDDFQEGQYLAIKRVLSRQDSIVLLPTGAGKSIIYQLTSLLVPGLTLIVCPIISLMDDQVDNLYLKGIDNVLAIHSGDKSNRQDNMELMMSNAYKMIYISPERFQIATFRDAISKLLLSTSIFQVAIDEAHCVSEWGHEFRTSYLNLGRGAKENCKKNGISPVLLALTGTASSAVLKDVQRELNIMGYDAIVTPKTFDRKELSFNIYDCKNESKENLLNYLLFKELPRIFKQPSSSFHELNDDETNCGIVFCPNVNGEFGVWEVRNSILQFSPHSNPLIYSGEKPKDAYFSNSWEKAKKDYASQFKHNQSNILVATKAFGMGIDKPNIRYTIHYGIPGSIESFYQEAGRAGRDRKNSHCSIIFTNKNHHLNNKWLDVSTPLSKVKEEYQKLSRNESDDVSRMLYFHGRSFIGIEEELNLVKEVIDYIIDNDLNEDSYYHFASPNRNTTEKSIHRLVILGIIKDYTLDYASNEFTITIGSKNKDDIINVYLQYVAGYNKGRVEKEKSIIDKYKTQPIKEFIVLACKQLIDFIYDTIEKGRRRGIKEMMQLAIDANKTTDKDNLIRERIIRYFESSYTEELNVILQNVNKFEYIVNLFDGKTNEIGEAVGGVRSATDASIIRGQTSRFLESTPDHPGLLYCRSLSEYYATEGSYQNIKQDYLASIKFAIERYSISDGQINEMIIYFLKNIKKLEVNDVIDCFDSSIKLLTIENQANLCDQLLQSNSFSQDINDVIQANYFELETTKLLNNIRMLKGEDIYG